MAQSQKQPVGGITFSILIALSLSRCLNDLLQSVISATYPLFKEDLGLSFIQIGLITLVYQLSASILQPITGVISDEHPVAWSLPVGMSSTMTEMINLTFSNNLYRMLVSVLLIGISSSILHPKASHITFLASGGKRGLTRSLFQIGGNLGNSLGPLLVALLVAPYGREHPVVFALFTLTAIGVMYPICKWYRSYLNQMKEQKVTVKETAHLLLPMDKTALSIGILLTLIFSRYAYMASLISYYAFYLVHRFNVIVRESQLYLFIFLVATVIGVLLSGPIGDRVGRKYIIWASILRIAPSSLLMPHAVLTWAIILSFYVGLMLSSTSPVILPYAQELLPTKLGLISDFSFDFAFGIAGIASAVLGNMADKFGIESVYNACAYIPLLGLVMFFLPNLKKQRVQV